MDARTLRKKPPAICRGRLCNTWNGCPETNNDAQQAAARPNFGSMASLLFCDSRVAKSSNSVQKVSALKSSSANWFMTSWWLSIQRYQCKKVVEDHQPRVESIILNQPLRASQVIDDDIPIYRGANHQFIRGQVATCFIGWYDPSYLVILTYTIILFFLWVTPWFFAVFFQPVLIHDPASFSSPCALVSSCAVSDATAKMSISSRCRVSNGFDRGDFQASK